MKTIYTINENEEIIQTGMPVKYLFLLLQSNSTPTLSILIYNYESYNNPCIKYFIMTINVVTLYQATLWQSENLLEIGALM